MSAQPDASGHVLQLLQQKATPLSTAQIVEVLKNAHSEEAVIKALEHWREQKVIQVVDGKWWLVEEAEQK